MQFVSLFNPVILEEDPFSANNGQFYFNSSSNVYRYYASGSWISLLDSHNIIYNIGSKVFHYGYDVDDYTIELSQELSNSIMHLEGNNTALINIPINSRIPIEVGSKIKIIKASDTLEMDISFDDGVMLYSPSTIYLKSIWDSIDLIKIDTNNWLIEAEFRDLY